MWKAIKEVKPLQDNILKQSKHRNIYLPICFTKTPYTYYSNLQPRCVFRSVSRCLQHIFNSITFVSALSFDALFWCVQLCTQHLKGIHWLSQLAGTAFFLSPYGIRTAWWTCAQIFEFYKYCYECAALYNKKYSHWCVMYL